MIKKIIVIAVCASAISLGSITAFAARGGDSQGGKTQVVVKNKSILGDLKMSDDIVISADMVAAGQSQTFDIASFCTYTNDKNGKVNVKITNTQKSFIVAGTNGEGDMPYTLAIGNQSVAYGDNTLTVDSNDAPASCKTVETVKLTFSGDTIKNAKAGTYDASFNVAVGSPTKA